MALLLGLGKPATWLPLRLRLLQLQATTTARSYLMQNPPRWMEGQWGRMRRARVSAWALVLSASVLEWEKAQLLGSDSAQVLASAEDQGKASMLASA
jgi:hypothetical protein